MRACPPGPRSEAGEAGAAAEDGRSFFDVAESDLVSSDGAASAVVRGPARPRAQGAAPGRRAAAPPVGPAVAPAPGRRCQGGWQRERGKGASGRAPRPLRLPPAPPR